MTTIAVTGVGGGVGQAILKCLHEYKYFMGSLPIDDLRILAVDSQPDATGFHFQSAGKFLDFKPRGLDEGIKQL